MSFVRAFPLAQAKLASIAGGKFRVGFLEIEKSRFTVIPVSRGDRSQGRVASVWLLYLLHNLLHRAQARSLWHLPNRPLPNPQAARSNLSMASTFMARIVSMITSTIITKPSCRFNELRLS